MEIRDIRNLTGMSQAKFATFLGIPVGTIRNWEQGISKPPKYVYQMILNTIRRDGMINVKTIKFVNLLNKLAECSLNGIIKFSEVTEESFDYDQLVYDDVSTNENKYRVIADAIVYDTPEYTREIIGYYDGYNNKHREECSIKVKFDDEDEPYICVHFFPSGEEIEISNGSWEFLNLLD